VKTTCQACNDKGRYEPCDPENGPSGEIIYCSCPVGRRAEAADEEIENLPVGWMRWISIERFQDVAMSLCWAKSTRPGETWYRNLYLATAEALAVSVHTR